jgi:hypothetical protein
MLVVCLRWKGKVGMGWSLLISDGWENRKVHAWESIGVLV